MPDWTNCEAVAEFAAAGAEIRGDDPVVAWAVAAHIWDRTPGTTPPVQMANQMGTVFSKHDCEPRWRERLPEIAVAEAVAVAFEGYYVGVVDEPVDHGGGDDLVTE